MGKFLKSFTAFIKKNYLIFIIGIAFYLLGITIALIVKSESVLNFYEEIALNYFEKIILPSSSPIKFLINRIINLILLFLFVFLFSLSKFSLYLNFIFVLYKGFLRTE